MGQNFRFQRRRQLLFDDVPERHQTDLPGRNRLLKIFDMRQVLLRNGLEGQNGKDGNAFMALYDVLQGFQAPGCKIEVVRLPLLLLELA